MDFKLANLGMYFTNIVVAFNWFTITPYINTVLYLCIIGAFLGTIIILLINPTFQYKLFKPPVSLELFQFFLIAGHFVPVYMFRKRQTLQETFELNVIAGAAALYVAYFTLFKHKLYALYGVPLELAGKTAIFLFFMFLGVHVLFFWK